MVLKMFSLRLNEGGAVVCPEKLGIIYLSFEVLLALSILRSYVCIWYKTLNSVICTKFSTSTASRFGMVCF